MSDASRGSEDDPLVDGNGLLFPVFLDCDVSSKEQQRERGHLGAVVQEDLRTHRGMSITHASGRITTNTGSVTGSGIIMTHRAQQLLCGVG